MTPSPTLIVVGSAGRTVTDEGRAEWFRTDPPARWDRWCQRLLSALDRHDRWLGTKLPLRHTPDNPGPGPIAGLVAVCGDEPARIARTVSRLLDHCTSRPAWVAGADMPDGNPGFSLAITDTPAEQCGALFHPQLGPVHTAAHAAWTGPRDLFDAGHVSFVVHAAHHARRPPVPGRTVSWWTPATTVRSRTDHLLEQLGRS